MSWLAFVKVDSTAGGVSARGIGWRARPPGLPRRRQPSLVATGRLDKDHCTGARMRRTSRDGRAHVVAAKEGVFHQHAIRLFRLAATFREDVLLIENWHFCYRARARTYFSINLIHCF